MRARASKRLQRECERELRSRIRSRLLSGKALATWTAPSSDLVRAELGPNSTNGGVRPRAGKDITAEELLQSAAHVAEEQADRLRHVGRSLSFRDEA